MWFRDFYFVFLKKWGTKGANLNQLYAPDRLPVFSRGRDGRSGAGEITLQTKERRAMQMNVTYTDLIQLLIFIVALVGLCYEIFKGKK